ncbi:hypothetical protein NDR87_09030 [Nocardia sp. CDC159]|uniref:Uncharacterized protein n=1 Tax=Nocardia pulmonis TaxID=2951408 RepID=A0A9X2E8E6_9NOCA|nr:MULTISPECIES: hypothetical protein [Nocardia]MCM6773611.1 hypothetical protein [Nocardia pulmonis]MCM6786498.1 hypothetical protein [Nocardia sp. CDC159]
MWAAARDVCPDTGLARLSYDQARDLLVADPVGCASTLTIGPVSTPGVTTARPRRAANRDAASWSRSRSARKVGDLGERGAVVGLQGGPLAEQLVQLPTHALGVSERHIRVERDGWILMRTASPEAAAGWIAEKRERIKNSEFRALVLDHDAAFDWSPEDPRLPELAARTRAWFAKHHSRSESQPVHNQAVARLAAQSLPEVSSPAWDRLAELLRG